MTEEFARSTKEKFKRLAKTIIRGKGKLTLLGVFLRDDSPGRWDLIVAGPWISEPHNSKAIRYIAAKVAEKLSMKERTKISRIVALPADAPIVGQIGSLFAVPVGKSLEISNCALNNLKINHALVVVCDAPKSAPANESSESDRKKLRRRQAKKKREKKATVG